MTNNENEINEKKINEKTKNPKRVAAGKRGAEARKMKAELKRKEIEHLNKENIQLKSISQSPKQITKDDDDEVKEDGVRINIYKNYIPFCLIGVIGLGLYIYKSKQVEPVQQQTVTQTVTPMKQKKEIDPFDFN